MASELNNQTLFPNLNNNHFKESDFQFNLGDLGLKTAIELISKNLPQSFLTLNLSNDKNIDKPQSARHSQEESYNHNEMLVENYNRTIQRIQTMHHYCEKPIAWTFLKDLEIISMPFKEKPSLSRKLKHTFLRFFEKTQPDLSILTPAIQEQVRQLAQAVSLNAVEAYVFVIDQINPFVDLVEFGSAFHFQKITKTTLEISFDVQSEEIVPKRILSLSATGKVHSTQMTKKYYHELVQDYVCSCALRIARDLFSILPVTHVIVHAQDKRLDLTSGQIDYATLLSVNFDRLTLLGLDFFNIDPSDTMDLFEHHMHLSSTGLSPVCKL